MKKAFYTHPLWFSSLICLILNDHMLKHSSAVPAVLRGMLSDVAGLIFFPAVAYAIFALIAHAKDLSRFSWTLTHAIVATLFVAFKMSPVFQHAAAQGYALFGLSFGVVADPHDLFALPALLSSWYSLSPERRAYRSRKLPLLAATALALVSSVASSSAPPPRSYADYSASYMKADAFFVNQSPDDITVTIFTPSTISETMCQNIGDEKYRKSIRFDNRGTWLLKSRESAPILPDVLRKTNDAPCVVAALRPDSAKEVIAVWNKEELPVIDVSVSHPKDKALSAYPHGAVIVQKKGIDFAYFVRGPVRLFVKGSDSAKDSFWSK